MNCANCQSENRQDARFCKRCGFWLDPNCPFCNAALPEAVVFCDHCGRQVNGQTQAFIQPAPISALLETAQPSPSTAEVVSPQPPSQPAPVKTDEVEVGSQSNEAQLRQYISEEMRSKLEAARASGDMVGERRIVTMMFCDVKGSTAAAEQLDPEEWSEIINGAFEHMIKPVYTYEGTVARLMGDGILAFFGAPLAHEDDPQRA
ncbi:MAG: zinc ribbon domain-containing protein, partial [Anaerolineales bacterium]|nr:zinc ribbon domain-containing protein [Anaerolineales bacterium]